MISRIYNIRKRGRFLPLSIIFAVLLLVAGHFTSCEPEDWDFEVNCNDCYDYEPDSANLIVYLTMNSENDSVPITIYRGPFEKGEIDWQDTATGEEFRLYSAMDREYAVRAEYKSGTKTIIAFDEDKMVVKDNGENCGSPCYMVKGGIFDLRLIE